MGRSRSRSASPARRHSSYKSSHRHSQTSASSRGHTSRRNQSRSYHRGDRGRSPIRRRTRYDLSSAASPSADGEVLGAFPKSTAPPPAANAAFRERSRSRDVTAEQMMIAQDVLLPQMTSELRNVYFAAAAHGRVLPEIQAAVDISKQLATSEERFCKHVAQLLGWKIPVQALVSALDGDPDITESYKSIYREWLQIALLRAGRHDLMHHFGASQPSAAAAQVSAQATSALPFGGNEAPSTPTNPAPDSPSPTRASSPSWKRATSPKGYAFEYNVSTGETRVPATVSVAESTWAKSVLPDGKRYMWRNILTGEIRFTDPHTESSPSASSALAAVLPAPPPLAPPQPPADIPVDKELTSLKKTLAEAKLWKTEFAVCGNEFYFNTATSQSQWFPPPELVLVREPVFKKRLAELQSKLRSSGMALSTASPPASASPVVTVATISRPQPPTLHHQPPTAPPPQGTEFNLACLILKTAAEVKQALDGFNSLVESRRLSKSWNTSNHVTFARSFTSETEWHNQILAAGINILECSDGLQRNMESPYAVAGISNPHVLSST